MLPHVQDIVNINERLMYIVLKGEVRIHIINCYTPTAAAETEEKRNIL